MEKLHVFCKWATLYAVTYPCIHRVTRKTTNNYLSLQIDLLLLNRGVHPRFASDDPGVLHA
jgi:hypothetical protein